MEYYINDLSKRVERTDKITFSYSNKNFEEKEDVYINKKFLTFYTSFFDKNYLFCDDVFSLPFEVSIAQRCLYHVREKIRIELLPVEAESLDASSIFINIEVNKK